MAQRSPVARTAVTPRLLAVEHRAGPLFAADYAPADGGARYLLLVPPFGEEMNRCRPMLTRQARALAELGIGSLLLDLYGCGDSAGDLTDAGWEDWREDVLAARRWLNEQRRRCIGLWGVRLGALLALDALRHAGAGAEPASRLLLWQPVLDGKSFINQLLRMRLAAAMAQPRTAEKKQTSADLRRRWQQGETLEIGGYALTSTLASGIESVSLSALLADCSPTIVARVDWLEVSGKQPPAVTPAAAAAAERWRATGVEVDLAAVGGDAFWTQYERTFAPALIDASCDRLKTVRQ